MSEATLNNLLEYLYGTLTPNNMQWLGEHLIEHAQAENEEVKPYTIEEINARISQSERDSAEGRVYDFDEAMRKWVMEDSDEENLKPYTVEELHQMVKEGERQMASGQWQDSEDMFRELEKEFEKEELQLAEA